MKIFYNIEDGTIIGFAKSNFISFGDHYIEVTEKIKLDEWRVNLETLQLEKITP
jgi:hypothetical protein